MKSRLLRSMARRFIRYEAFNLKRVGCSMSDRLILGSRGSELARAQTRLVQEALKGAWPELETALQIISTRGDEKALELAQPVDPRAGRKGLFTGEIERALKAGKIDVAVHSAKDLPSEESQELSVRAVLPRARVEDILVTKKGGGVNSLAAGATVATGSVRRRCQMQSIVRGVKVVDLRGNVPTRLRKLAANDWDAVVLARAGLERLGFDLSDTTFNFEGRNFFHELLPCDRFLPAGGQGVIALQVRKADARACGFVDQVNHAETYLCLRAEREFLRLLQGDCDSPVGVRATIAEGVMSISAQVFQVGCVKPRRACAEGLVEAEGAERLAARLLELLNVA